MHFLYKRREFIAARRRDGRMVIFGGRAQQSAKIFASLSEW